MRYGSLLISAALITLIGGVAMAQATRTFVSGVGNDADPCSRTAPCRTFAGAFNKTAPSGEISVLDPGGYGGLTITKSISINGEWGGEAGSLVAGAGVNGITINAAATDRVNLRGLYIQGVGSATNGIRYLAGGSLHVQNTVVQGFRATTAGGGNAILVAPTSGNLVLDLDNVLLVENGVVENAGAGLAIRPTGSSVVRVTGMRVQSLSNRVGIDINGDNGTGAIDLTLADSTLSRNTGDGLSCFSPNAGDALVRVTVDSSMSAGNGGIGVHSVGQRCTVRVKDTVSTANAAAGLQANNSGVLQSYGDNATEGNGNANAGVTPAPPS
jgi:hypothetical protein